MSFPPTTGLRRAALAAVAILVVAVGTPAATTAAAGATTGVAAGAAGAAGAAAVAKPAPVRPVHPGYWLAASDGGVYSFGTGNLGQVRPTPLNKPVVGVAAVAQGGGYWLVASDGGIFDFGDAAFYGSTGNVRLNKPIVGMASTPDGKGYWLVASDGGIFDFGDAAFYGSTGSVRLNKPIVGMASTPDGRGYWLVASDGGIFDFGDAAFSGSTGNVALNKPVVGMASTPDGRGYWLVASDGGIFDFGDAAFSGSTGSVALNKPIVGMAPSPLGGYWLVASDGGLFDFGGAPYLGSTGGAPGPAPIIGMAVTAHGQAYTAGAIGTDISWPQCGAPYPRRGAPVSIVGVNNGREFTYNPCFASEAANAGINLSVYINVNAVTGGDPNALMGPVAPCGPADLVCQGYNWGYNSAKASVDHVRHLGYDPQVWWLDVEAPCASAYPLWLCGTAGQASNAAVIGGAIAGLHADGLIAGIYSTYYQWPLITGGTPGAGTVDFPGLPIWIATVPPSVSAWPAYCADPSYQFAGGTPWLVQWLGGQGSPTEPFDGDLACQT